MKKQTINVLIMVLLLVGMSGFISAVNNVSLNSTMNDTRSNINTTSNATMSNTNITVNNSASSNISVGALPGSFFYGLDKGISNLRLALMFNQEKKAQLALKIAQKRLAEAQILAQRGKYNRSLQAEKAHKKIMKKAEKAIIKMNQEGNANKTFRDLQKITRMQAQLENHLRLISQMKMQLLSQKGQNLTQEQLNQLDNLFSSMENSSVNVSLSAQQQKENMKTRYKALKNLTNSQLNQTVEKIDSKEGYKKRVREREKQDNQTYQTEIVVRLRNLKRLQSRLNNTNTTQKQKEQLQKVIALHKKNLKEFQQKKELLEQRKELIQNYKEKRNELIAQMRENQEELQNKGNRTHTTNSENETENFQNNLSAKNGLKLRTRDSRIRNYVNHKKELIQKEERD